MQLSTAINVYLLNAGLLTKRRCAILGESQNRLYADSALQSTATHRPLLVHCPGTTLFLYTSLHFIHHAGGNYTGKLYRLLQGLLSFIASHM